MSEAGIRDLRKLRRKFRSRVVYERLVLSIIFLSDLWLIREMFILPDKSDITTFSWVFPLILLVPMGLVKYMFLFRSREDIFRSGREKIGKYNLDRVIKMIGEVTAPLEKEFSKEMPGFYLIKSRQFDLFCVNVSFLNFIKSLNAVVIPEIVFSILTEEEIKAMLAHEIAHFGFFKSPVRNTPLVVNLFRAIMPVYIASHLRIHGTFLIVCAALFLFLGVSFLVRILLAGSIYRETEFLCDQYASEQFGLLNFINGLMTGTRLNENLSWIFKEVLSRVRKGKEHKKEHVQVIVNEALSSLPPRILTRREIRKGVGKVFRSDKVLELGETLGGSEMEERDRELDEFEEKNLGKDDFPLARWKEFDTRHPKFRIDEVEYPRLIRSLEKNPNRQLFDIVTDNFTRMKFNTHPTVRERILFLHKNRKENE